MSRNYKNMEELGVAWWWELIGHGSNQNQTTRPIPAPGSAAIIYWYLGIGTGR